jgi:hypothetical protein
MADDQSSPPINEGNVVLLSAPRNRLKSTVSQPEIDWLREKRDQFLDGLNKDFCVVNDHGVSWIFQEVENQLRPGFRNIYRLREQDFELLYKNERLTAPVPAPSTQDPNLVKLVTKTAAEWWLESRQRRQFRKGVEFAPGQKLRSGWYNTFSGFAVEPLKPSASSGCPLFHQHALLMCAGDRVCYDYLLNWMARAIQQPGSPGRTLIVLAGKQGVGKGELVQYWLKLFGPYGLHLRDPAQLHGQFNLHLQQCIGLYADEAIWAGDKTIRGILYGLATEDRIPIRAMYQNLYEANNCLHLIMASNHNWVAQVDTDDRRTVVFEAPDTKKGDKAYFGALAREREHAGARTLLWELQHRNISNFNPEEIPDTPARRRQKRLGLSSCQAFWLDVLDREYVYCSDYGVRSVEEWQPFVSTQLVWAGYNQWMDVPRRYQRETNEDLGRMLTELYGDSTRPRGWHPVREVKKPGHRGSADSAQPGLTYPDTDERIDRDHRLPDDPEGLVVLKPRPRGYTVGDILQARDRFDALYGPLDTPWHDPAVSPPAP